jgi:hypothetical protein
MDEPPCDLRQVARQSEPYRQDDQYGQKAESTNQPSPVPLGQRLNYGPSIWRIYLGQFSSLSLSQSPPRTNQTVQAAPVWMKHW